MSLWGYRDSTLRAQNDCCSKDLDPRTWPEAWISTWLTFHTELGIFIPKTRLQCWKVAADSEEEDGLLLNFMRSSLLLKVNKNKLQMRCMKQIICQWGPYIYIYIRGVYTESLGKFGPDFNETGDFSCFQKF